MVVVVILTGGSGGIVVQLTSTSGHNEVIL